MLDKQRDKKKNAENCKRWQDQRKNVPTFRQIEAERKKEKRKSRTPAQVEKDRSTARERMRRYREKQKSKETEKENLQLTCILTKSQKEKQRGQWRVYLKKVNVTKIVNRPLNELFRYGYLSSWM
ncbi:uncharacterized protein LOC134701447 [Mytilus trossulus]|uniref:uncharacterized protein LOC134701447 n=1 Tax=Mytilus trossulus TaxID=6551 RepID=UPI0030076BA9